MIFCQHKRVGWPIRNRMRCLDCGKSRSYGRDGLLDGAIGPWKSDHDLAEASKREALTIAQRKLEVFCVRS